MPRGPTREGRGNDLEAELRLLSEAVAGSSGAQGGGRAVAVMTLFAHEQRFALPGWAVAPGEVPHH
jgi:hypothetical protein